jgi:signal transduction histidine kinase
MSGSNGTTRESPRTFRWGGVIRVRLAAMGVLIALLVATIIWVERATWNRVREIEREFSEFSPDSFQLGLHLQRGVGRLNARALQFQLVGDLTEREGFHQEAHRSTERIAATQTRLATQQEQELAREIRGAFDRYLIDILPLLEHPARPVRKDSASLIQQQLVELSSPLLALCDKLVESQDQALALRFATSGHTLVSLRHLMQFSSFLLLACTVTIVWLAYRAVVAPLRLKLDLTEQTVVRQEKLASLGTLAAGVAHEIRNPLTAIKFRLFSFKKELPHPFAEHEDLAVIHGEIDRLERIVKDFLQFARPSEPQLVITPAKDILHQVHTLLRPSLEKHGIQLKVESLESVNVNVDRDQIEQVLINLVHNAADSIGRDGTITLRATSGVRSLARQPIPVVTFDVIDTGKGIPPELEQRIFDPFFSSKEGGTGLGLPIAARIAENHQGLIHYQSHPQRGTTFSLVLPRTTENANAPAPH